MDWSSDVCYTDSRDCFGFRANGVVEWLRWVGRKFFDPSGFNHNAKRGVRGPDWHHHYSAGFQYAKRKRAQCAGESANQLARATDHATDGSTYLAASYARG
jgi:hypothetical protein